MKLNLVWWFVYTSIFTCIVQVNSNATVCAIMTASSPLTTIDAAPPAASHLNHLCQHLPPPHPHPHQQDLQMAANNTGPNDDNVVWAHSKFSFLYSIKLLTIFLCFRLKFCCYNVCQSNHTHLLYPPPPCQNRM
jgi:hypothetical protein